MLHKFVFLQDCQKSKYICERVNEGHILPETLTFLITKFDTYCYLICVLQNLLNQLGEKIRCEALPGIFMTYLRTAKTLITV